MKSFREGQRKIHVVSKCKERLGIHIALIYLVQNLKGCSVAALFC